MTRVVEVERSGQVGERVRRQNVQGLVSRCPGGCWGEGGRSGTMPRLLERTVISLPSMALHRVLAASDWILSPFHPNNSACCSALSLGLTSLWGSSIAVRIRQEGGGTLLLSNWGELVTGLVIKMWAGLRKLKCGFRLRKTKNPQLAVLLSDQREEREGYKTPEERDVCHGPPDRSCTPQEGIQPFCNDPRGGIPEN